LSRRLTLIQISRGVKTGPLTGQPPKLSSEAKADLLNSSEQSNGQSAPGKDVPTLPSKAVEQDDLVIPVCIHHALSNNVRANETPQLIDFSNFLKGDTALKKTTALAILHAFQTSGFIYLSNYGISDPGVQSVFRYSASFFSRPQDQKDALAWYSPEANRGYTGHGREKTTHLTEKEDVEALRAEVPDLKESLEIGRDDEEGMPNMWLPEGDVEGQEFKEVMLAFFDECKGLQRKVMRAIAVGLDIEETWFDGFTDRGDNTLRLLHYPAVEREVFQKNKLQVRAGAHSDYGMSISCRTKEIDVGLTSNRLNNPPLPRLPRRPPSPIPQRNLHRRNTHPRHHRRERR
jgi:hypothetical protein